MCPRIGWNSVPGDILCREETVAKSTYYESCVQHVNDMDASLSLEGGDITNFSL